jgi:DNA replication and repair protein RecF
MRPIYEGLAEEPLDLAYECTLGDDVKDLSRDEIRDLFLQRLAELRADELRRRQTLVGPQRDDVRFQIAGRDARSFASQGQQRSVVLAWKMAEVEICREVTQNEPILLLDDVMSELDEGRRAAVASFVDRGVQMVVTTTNLGYFSHDALTDAEVVSFDER